jgi:hypothetical protein
MLYLIKVQHMYIWPGKQLKISVRPGGGGVERDPLFKKNVLFSLCVAAGQTEPFHVISHHPPSYGIVVPWYNATYLL